MGESIVFNCTVDVLNDLYTIIVNVSIARNDGSTIYNDIGSGDTTVTYSLSPLRSSDAGGYECRVNITQPDINYQFNDMESAQIILTSKFYL